MKEEKNQPVQQKDKKTLRTYHEDILLAWIRTNKLYNLAEMGACPETYSLSKLNQEETQFEQTDH